MTTPIQNVPWHQQARELRSQGSTTPQPLSLVVEVFVKGKQEILSEALANESVFCQHHLLDDLEFSREAAVRDDDSLSGKVASLALSEGFEFRHNAFSRAVEDTLHSGKIIAELLATERSYRRAIQLLTWLDISNDTVLLSARFSLRPCEAPRMQPISWSTSQAREAWYLKSSADARQGKALPFVAGD